MNCRSSGNPLVGMSNAMTTKMNATTTWQHSQGMEELVVHCAKAFIESNDATVAQQMLWVLNNVDGDGGNGGPNHRLAHAFLRALAVSPPPPLHRFSSAVDLAAFIDLTPWHRFGFTAANAAILRAAAAAPILHVVDLGLAHCMQLPTLVDSVAALSPPPLLLRLTVVPAPENHPPGALRPSYDDLGLRLASFARSRRLPLDFHVVHSSHADGFASLLHHLHATSSPEESLVINCHMRLRCIPDELRSLFLKAVRALEPRAVVVVEEDADLTSESLPERVRSAFNYMWIPFDAAEASFLGGEQRRWYEAGVCWRVHNLVAGEGTHRVERLEPKGRWAQRMGAAGFRGEGFGERDVAEVKAVVDDHAAGWGVKCDDHRDLVLTWKGHNVVFATLWVPA